MAATVQSILHGVPYINASTSGRLLTSGLELSFWGGVDPESGEIIDRYHPLSGRHLKDIILAISGSKGSCTGSAVILELILNGNSPKALVFQHREDIVTLGVIIAEELFGKAIPIVSLDHAKFQLLQKWDGQTIHISRGQISNEPLRVISDTEFKDSEHFADNAAVDLSDYDLKALEGSHGQATKTAMKIIVRVAQIMGARGLMDICQAHVDGAWYGPGSVAVGKKLRDQGGKFRVPTTINAITIDQRQWRALGIDESLGAACDELTEAFMDMGCKISFTCAPYQLESAPKQGDRVAWGESNAVVYANSILGARTLKYPNMLEALIALTGRAPKTGVYFDENRLASVHINVKAPEVFDDAFWPMLGYIIGDIAGARIPVITGLELLQPSSDDFKAFSAAFATSSSAPMYHIVNLTPEAISLDVVSPLNERVDKFDIGKSDLKACWDKFNKRSVSRQVGLISLGNPHFSLREIKKLSELCQGKTKAPSVAMIVTCGRSQHGLASQAGYIDQLEQFGVKFLTDTCWCSIREPVMPRDVGVVMTNSGKYIHYGPGLTGRKFCFGSLQMCVDAACLGVSSGQAPAWLS